MNEDVPGRESRVAAELDLGRRREPAQVVVRIVVLARHRKRSLAEVILLGNRLHLRIIEPAFERYDGCWVAGQRPVGERIDLEEGEGRHCALSVMSDGSRVSRSVCPSGSTWIRISVPGNRSCSCSSTRSSRSWASWTVQSAGTQTWNWPKRNVPLLRVRQSWRPASSGYSAAVERRARRSWS